jgi:hypothetical protein
MSAKNNVNPDHYKVAGRDRPDDRISGGPKPQTQLHDEEQARWREREQAREKRESGKETEKNED